MRNYRAFKLFNIMLIAIEQNNFMDILNYVYVFNCEMCIAFDVKLFGK